MKRFGALLASAALGAALAASGPGLAFGGSPGGSFGGGHMGGGFGGGHGFGGGGFGGAMVRWRFWRRPWRGGFGGGHGFGGGGLGGGGFTGRSVAVGNWGHGNWGHGNWGHGNWGRGNWGRGNWGQNWGNGNWGNGWHRWHHHHYFPYFYGYGGYGNYYNTQGMAIIAGGASGARTAGNGVTSAMTTLRLRLTNGHIFPAPPWSVKRRGATRREPYRDLPAGRAVTSCLHISSKSEIIAVPGDKTLNSFFHRRFRGKTSQAQKQRGIGEGDWNIALLHRHEIALGPHSGRGLDGGDEIHERDRCFGADVDDPPGRDGRKAVFGQRAAHAPPPRAAHGLAAGASLRRDRRCK